jgi:hypothetical protein
VSNPNLRQTFHELTSPTDLSASGTPDSSSTGNSLQHPRYPLQQQYGVNNTLPDLSAMMFPSADPFAYPNQPMMEFDNVKRENMEMMAGAQNAPMFMPSGTTGPPIYDDLEGQLFGPLPPYLSQGQPNYDMQVQMDGGSNMMGGLNPQEMAYHTGMTPNSDMNFDGIFTGEDEEWSNMLGDQGFRQ